MGTTNFGKISSGLDAGAKALKQGTHGPLRVPSEILQPVRVERRRFMCQVNR